MLFTRDDLLRLLHGLNPWWTGRTTVLPKFRRPLHGLCRRHLEASSEQFVLLVSGCRGTGKTTMLLQLATDLVAGGIDPRSVLYLAMGHPVLSRVPLPQILQIHGEMIVHARDRPSMLLLDEVHYARDWDQHVKALLGDSARFRIVATESVQVIERALVTETQMDRWTAVSAPTLSFHEYLSLRGIDPSKDREVLDVTRPEKIDAGELEAACRAVQPSKSHFRSYLVRGGLPWLAAHTEDPGSSGVLQEDVVENVLRRDIGVHFGARNVEDLKRLFVFLCMHTGEVFPVQRYADEVEISPATVANHLELLERCFLVRRIAPLATGDKVVQKARYRMLVSDTTLRAAQLLRPEDSLADPEELQRTVQTSVVRHAFERYGRNLARFHYWRDPRTGRALELILKLEDRQLAFKVMCNRPPALKAGDPLVSFCRDEPVTRAFLVTPEDVPPDVFRVRGMTTEFVRIPAHVLAYLFGRAEARPAPLRP